MPEPKFTTRPQFSDAAVKTKTGKTCAEWFHRRDGVKPHFTAVFDGFILRDDAYPGTHVWDRGAEGGVGERASGF